jgi:lysozyme
MLTLDEQKSLRKLLIHDEGKRNFIYKDSLGNETVGIGHLCANGFSDAVVDLIYSEDWQKVYNFLLKSFDWFCALASNRKLALISMVFNLGTTRFLKFEKTIAAFAKRDYHEAAKQMLMSKWAKEVPNRVFELAKIIETGELT